MNLGELRDLQLNPTFEGWALMLLEEAQRELFISYTTNHNLIKTYTWPDGSETLNEPADNEVFVFWDAKGNPVQMYIYQKDGFYGTWISQGIDYAAELDEVELKETKKLVCECGKEKHGFASHAGWCDLC